jgi:hypothetical protein
MRRWISTKSDAEKRTAKGMFFGGCLISIALPATLAFLASRSSGPLHGGAAKVAQGLMGVALLAAGVAFWGLKTLAEDWGVRTSSGPLNIDVACFLFAMFTVLGGLAVLGHVAGLY